MLIDDSEMDTVSVIIPCFNAQGTLLRAIHSVQNQSHALVELIVIDGGSSDGSLLVLESLTVKPSYWISEKDKGVYDAINKGIEVAKGKWIYIIGADDALSHCEVIAEMLSNAKKNTEIIFGYVENESSGNSFVPLLHKSEFSKMLYWKNTLHQQSVLYRATLFQDFRFNVNYRVLSDYDFHLHLLSNSAIGASVSTIVARCGSTGLSKNFNTALYLEELKIKMSRLNPLLFALNIPWVILKFTTKKLGNLGARLNPSIKK
ncbi:MAG: glycosyltransferase family 2 protein [Flavobacteriales bacterium]|nr:glycosyltransferase family 2 protein [Flavobacteriales bacterium]